MDPDRERSDDLLHAEALVRGWGLLVTLAVLSALPFVWVRGGDGDDHYETGLTAVPTLLTTTTGDLGPGHPGVDVAVLALRVATVALVVGFLVALFTALRWTDSASLAEHGPWVRAVGGWLLLAGTLVLMLAAGLVGDPDGPEPDRYEGLDVGPGVVMLLVTAAFLLVPPAAGRWPRPPNR